MVFSQLFIALRKMTIEDQLWEITYTGSTDSIFKGFLWKDQDILTEKNFLGNIVKPIDIMSIEFIKYTFKSLISLEKNELLTSRGNMNSLKQLWRGVKYLNSKDEVTEEIKQLYKDYCIFLKDYRKDVKDQCKLLLLIDRRITGGKSKDIIKAKFYNYTEQEKWIFDEKLPTYKELGVELVKPMQVDLIGENLSGDS
ncbi:MAG: hypothetical protein K0Q51_107 [Rickettsiaceae bacterium]|jgi:hypothetical protein|nr:hypothetical protein [Rickettsiaceae bacterium]